MHLSPLPNGLGCCPFCCGALFVTVAPFVGICNCSMFCCVLLCVHSSFAIILKRELVALLSLCFLVSRDCSVAFLRGATDSSAV